MGPGRCCIGERVYPEGFGRPGTSHCRRSTPRRSGSDEICFTCSQHTLAPKLAELGVLDDTDRAAILNIAAVSCERTTPATISTKRAERAKPPRIASPITQKARSGSDAVRVTLEHAEQVALTVLLSYPTSTVQPWCRP
jgi:hypothetical protein